MIELTLGSAYQFKLGCNTEYITVQGTEDITIKIR